MGLTPDAPLQKPSLVGRPVLAPVAAFWDAVAAGGVVLEGHAYERNGSAAAGLLALAPCTNALKASVGGAYARGLQHAVELGELVLPEVSEISLVAEHDRRRQPPEPFDHGG